MPLQAEAKTMRLGLFGGTFDPVHYGHLLLAECCREQGHLDEVRFLPAAVPPHKRERDLAPAEARVEMLQLAVAGQPTFSVCRWEVDRRGVSYTVDTLTHFRRGEPAAELFFLLGADMLEDLPGWRNAAEVCRLATPLVVRRAATGDLDCSCLAGVASSDRIEQIRRHVVEMPEIGTSSTEIRRRVAAGQSIRYLTPPAVAQFIETHGLYV